MTLLSVAPAQDSERIVLRPQGRLDAFQAPELAKQLAEQERAHNYHIVINMRDVEFVDSVALSTLVQGLKHALQAGGDLVLCEIQQPVRIIFELTRLDKAFQIFDSETQAVASTRVEA